MLGQVGRRALTVAPGVSGLRPRDKAVLAGLYFSKFDSEALRSLGFASFAEAFNVIGAALGARPASIKNYRDEFDPLFPNRRRGWRARATRPYCKAVYDSFGGLNLDHFTNVLKEVVYQEPEIDLLVEQVEMREGRDFPFAKRLITGQAAEQYFRSKYKEVHLFKDFELEDTTRLGCGFDFKLASPSRPFYGVEVKGLDASSGSVTLTDKEHSAAALLRGRFILFVVKNFKERPFHELHQDPLDGKIVFSRAEQRVPQVSWTAKL